MSAENRPDVLEVPRTQGFQFGGGMDGSVEQDINLFQGAVSFTVPLVAMKGRSGLNLDVAAVYHSNVAAQVGQSNRDAPTGVLGLGWDLFVARIDATYGTAGNRDSATFYLTTRGTRNRMYRTTRPWQRGRLESSCAASLDRGTLEGATLTALLRQSLCVDPAASVTVLEAGQRWSITDPVNELILLVEAAEGHLRVLDGGTGYELESFDFSQVRYYAPFERWVVVSSNGLSSVFGGRLGLDSNGNRTSCGNSIVWGVRWNTFSGPSGAARDGSGQRLQSQYPMAWSLSSERAVNLDEVSYSYLQTTQQVGADGLVYTKAIYLSEITDMFGRTATLNYAAKQYNTEPGGPREYLDPYHAVPNNEPDAYQSRYETLYLASISCRDKQGGLLFTTELEYSLGQFCATPQNAPPSFSGDVGKRVLTSIRQVHPNGSSLPPLTFSYHGPAEPNAGAIATKQMPEGALVSYAYQKKNLTACSRSLDITPALTSAEPRVWFGSDYAVFLWIGSDRFSVAVYTWTGRWVRWQPSTPVFDFPVDPDDIVVTPQDNFFTIDCGAANGLTSEVLFFHKNNRILGGWLETPGSRIVLQTADRQVVAGDRFFAVADCHANTVTRYTWDTVAKVWLQEPVPTPPLARNPTACRIFLSAASNLLTALYYDIQSAPGTKQSLLALDYLDEAGTWHEGGRRTATELNIGGSDVKRNFRWRASGWVFAATAITEDRTSDLAYHVTLYTWGRNDAPSHTWNEPFQASYTMSKSDSGARPYAPWAQVSPTGMVASGPHLLRFTGETWLANDNLQLQLPVEDGTVFWFAQGPDIVVKTENSPARVIGMAQVFDPNTQSYSWIEGPLSLHDSPPIENRLSSYFPTAGQDFISFDDSLYFRGTSSDWIDSVQAPVHRLPPGINTTALVNEAPRFLVYLKESGGGPVETEFLLLEAGFVGDTDSIPQNFYRVVGRDGHVDEHPTGKYPAGPGSFVTFLPPDDTFDKATSLRLYRFLNGSIVEPVTDHPVLSVTLDDGYIRKEYRYDFDADTAAVDSQGLSCKYYQSRLSVGPDNIQGSTRYTFINGVGNPSPGNPTDDAVLDGQLSRRELFDASGRLVSSQANAWTVVDRIQGLQDGVEYSLNGIYAQRARSVNVLDGVETVQEFTYDPRAGQINSTTIQIYNALGQLETHRKSTELGYTVYPLLGYLNILGAQAGLTSTVAIESGAPVVSSQQNVTWELFPGRTIGSAGPLQLLGESQSYSRRSGGEGTRADAPEQWQFLTQATRRNEYGYVQETVNAAGLVKSTLYSADNGLSVATFTGASLAGEEAYYFGFEPYESPGSWALDHARTPLVTTLCNTGSRCLSLPAGVTGVPLCLTPRNRAQPFLFSFWAAIDPRAATDSPIEAWRIEYDSSHREALPATQTISVTSREWRYYHVVIDLRNVREPVTLRLVPVNTGTSTVFVDNVCFSTLVGSARIQVFDHKTYLLQAEVGPYNQVKRRVYDRLRRQVAFTNEFQSVINLIAPSLSRQTRPAFDSAAPNSQLAVQPKGDTCYERFLNNGVWSNHFASATPALWCSAEGLLSYSGTGPGGITFANPSFTSDYMVRFELEARSPVAVGIQFGETVMISWNPATHTWSLSDTLNGVTLPGRVATATPTGDWLAVLGSDALIFAVNGQVVFDYLPQRMPAGAPTILVHGPADISQFIIGASPQIAMRYFDGSGKSLQGQSIEGGKVVVAAIVHDATATPVVQVKPVAYDGVTQGLISFRTDVVTAFDWDSGVMSGKAASAHPEDEGYPYRRRLLEASPLRRIIEMGAPGKPFAITHLSNSSPAGRHTVRYSYGSNGNDVINATLGWPAGQYSLRTTTDQDGKVTHKFSDKLGRTAGTANLLDAATKSYLFNTEHPSYPGGLLRHSVRLPNYYAPPAGSTAEDWVNVVESDLLRRTIRTTTPDAGTARSIHNSVGQTRFFQDAQAAERGLVRYNKYDLYGRTIESGLVATAWEPPTLQTRADTPDWPTAEDGARVVRRMRYDGDGATVNALGRMVSVSDHDEETSRPISVTTYAYDDFGQVGTYGLGLAEGGESYFTRYTYDNQGSVSGITYASGFTLQTEQDSVGRVVTVTDGGGKVLSAYTYTNDDQVKEQALLPGSPGAVTVTYSYNSPGWLAKVSSPLMTEVLSYASGASGNTPHYSGRIGSTKTSFGVADPPADFPTTLSYAYQYDTLGRLQVAQAMANGVPQPAWSLGLSQAATYDGNGNFLTVDDDGTLEHYQYTPGTNQVINTDGEGNVDFAVNANGAITRATPRDITEIDYQLTTQRATRIRTGGGADIHLQYDSNSNRILKTQGNTTRLYVRGINGWPLVEWDKVNGVVTTTTEYLYGPRGLFAIRVNGEIFPVLTDHLQSVRGLVGAGGGLMEAFHYSPFGRVVASYGSTGLLRYRFTGYEYDLETGLYNAAARLYDPALKRFYSVDPKMQFFSPYVYGGNNPVSMLDPTGEAAWWAILVGAVVGALGTVATVVTGGAGVVLLAAEEWLSLTVSTAVSAVAGAVGSVAGDATTAGLAHEKFTARRALVDTLSGAAGSVVGEVAGGVAARGAMGLAFSKNISPLWTTVIGTSTSTVVGGVSGAAASGAITSAITGQSFFSTGTALNMVVSGVAGLGGALMASGTAFGWFGNTMPVKLGKDDFHLLRNEVRLHPDPANSGQVYRFMTFNPEEIGYYHNDAAIAHQLSPSNTTLHDVIDVHGAGRFVFPTVAQGYMRPMSAKLFADYVMTHHGDWVGGGAPLPPLKLSVCFGALPGRLGSVGQSLAKALGRTTQGNLGTVSLPYGADRGWTQFNP